MRRREVFSLQRLTVRRGIPSLGGPPQAIVRRRLMESAMTVSTEQADSAPTRREAVESSLLQATEDLLSEGNSYTDLSVEQIAARAGISRTAFYFYFNDKRHVLMRLVE